MAKISELEKKQINAGLIQDIKDFAPIFNRSPTVAEVTNWAEDFYFFKHPAKSTITNLINESIKVQGPKSKRISDPGHRTRDIGHST